MNILKMTRLKTALTRSPGHSALRADSLAFGLLAAIGSFVAAGDAVAEDAAPATLTVAITGIEDTAGDLYVQVLAGEAAFKNGGPAAAQFVLPARAGTTRFSFDSLAAGEYAIRVMQDLDGDGELKTNMVGMPQEPWGTSNDAKGRFGPPKWEQAKITVPGEPGQVHTITLQ